jgi:hypothetical protein
MDMLLRLPLLEAAQLRELIQHLPDPQAAAQEMVRRGWITQDQWSSLFPDPQQRPAPQETMLVGFGDGETPPDADCEDWGLTVSDEEDKADVPPEVEWARPDRTEEEMRPEPETVEAVPVLAAPESTPQFEWDVMVPPVADGDATHRQESDTDKLPRQWMGWASKGLLMCILFLGSLFVGVQLAGPVVAPQAVPQGLPTPPQQVDPFQQWVRQQIKETQKQIMETAKQKMQMPPVVVQPPVVGQKPVPVEVTPPPAVVEVKPRRKHVVWIRQGDKQWKQEYDLDEHGNVVIDDVQRLDAPHVGAQPGRPNPQTPPAVDPPRKTPRKR